MNFTVGREGNPPSVNALDQARIRLEALRLHQINLHIIHSHQTAWYGLDAFPEKLRNKVRPFNEDVHAWGFECVYRLEDRSNNRVEAGYLFGDKARCLGLLEIAEELGALEIVKSLFLNQPLFDDSTGWETTVIQNNESRWFRYVLETVKAQCSSAIKEVDSGMDYRVFEITGFVSRCLMSIDNAIYMMNGGVEILAELRKIEAPQQPFATNVSSESKPEQTFASNSPVPEDGHLLPPTNFAWGGKYHRLRPRHWQLLKAFEELGIPAEVDEVNDRVWKKEEGEIVQDGTTRSELSKLNKALLELGYKWTFSVSKGKILKE